jgi:hypothetical protein
MKTGTSWVYDYLRKRGDVCLPVKVKETFYFDKNYSRGARWYKSHFSTEASLNEPIVDVSPSYFHSDMACRRIANDIGTVRLVIVLRDPVRRTWSHYLHLKRKGYIRCNIKEAYEKYPEIIEASRYHERIDYWKRYHTKEYISILFQEDLKDRSAKFTSQLCAALAIDNIEVSSDQPSRSNSIGLPRFLWIASIGTSAGNILRKYGFYSLINVAKAVGLKKLFYGDALDRSRIPQPSPEELEWIKGMLKLDDEPYTQIPEDYL